MANNFMHFGALAKHSPVKTYAALLSVSMKKFENKFQDEKKISILVYL